MTTYYNVTTPVKGDDGKTRFTKIGVAFPGKDHQNYAMKITLDLLPTGDKPELILFAPRPKQDDDPDYNGG